MSEELVHIERGNLVESRHYGDLAMVDRSGSLLWYVGDPLRVTYARSSAKPLQALPLVESGAADAFEMTDEEIALCCASHSGEAMHVERVRALLARLGLSETDLQCGVHPPYRSQMYEEILRTGQAVTAVHNNCSGKHAGMLAMAKYLGADVGTYLQADHPVQQQILKVVTEVCEVAPDAITIGTDGCGVPVFAMPLQQLALAFAKFARPVGQAPRREKAMSRIATAMMQHPELVAGTETFCTAFMGAKQGSLLGKAGAEGVYCAGLTDQGYGLCVKVDDGNPRAVYPAVLEALRQAKVVPDEVITQLQSFHRPILQNHQGTVVGRIEPVFELKQAAP